MPIVISEASGLGTELKKWNTPRNQFVVIDGEAQDGQDGRALLRGMGAVGFEPYPRMLYKAQQTQGGQWRCLQPPPHPHLYPTVQAYDYAILVTETFNKTCYCIVKNEDEHKRERANGWRDSQQEALDAHEGYEQDIAQAAAEAHWGVKRMGEQARAEFEAAGAATSHHVADIKPKRKYTKRAKVAPVAVTGHGEVEVTE